MKCLFGYMVLSSAALLGLLGSVVFTVAIHKYEIPIDLITFYTLLANFAIVGTMSIFFPRGIPTYITQSYLVITSVILAWQLSQFNDWTAWCLLIALALYDLCAVLTPCGPLKALIKLMSKDNAPALPGLLYEAQLPVGVERPSVGTSATTNNSRNRNGNNSNVSSQSRSGKRNDSETNMNNNQQPQQTQQTTNNPTRLQGNNINHNVQQQTQDYDSNQGHVTTGVIPLAIALIYRLPIQSPPQFATTHRDRSQYDASQLTSDVVVIFPRSGGYIQSENGTSEEEDIPPSSSSSRKLSLFSKKKRKKSHSRKYIVYDRHQNIKRVLVVDKDSGRVFEEVDGDDNDGGGINASHSIKLGLVRIFNWNFLTHIYSSLSYFFCCISYLSIRVISFSTVCWYPKLHNIALQPFQHVCLLY